jgi:hypothetical protein
MKVAHFLINGLYSPQYSDRDMGPWPSITEPEHLGLRRHLMTQRQKC